MTVYSIAQSGLTAAQTRVGVSAANIANARSTAQTDAQGNVTNQPYEARRVQLTQPVPGGGVVADVVIDQNPTVRVQAFESDVLAAPDGSIEVPNVNYAEELIEQQMATYDFKANLKVLETQKEMEETLLDVLA